MLEYVPEKVRRILDEAYNYLLPQNNHAYFNHFPQYQLIYKWNNLHLLFKSVSEPGKYRSEPKSHFLEKNTRLIVPNKTVTPTYLSYKYIHNYFLVDYICKYLNDSFITYELCKY